MKYNEHLEDISDSLLVEEIRKNQIKSYIIIGLIFLLCMSGIAIYSYKTDIKNLKVENSSLNEELDFWADLNNLTSEIGEQLLFKRSPETLNDSTLYNYLIKLGAWYPDILLAQAKLESANYTSNLYKNSNNVFGMKVVSYRNTVQTGIYNGYGTYVNWKLSVIDRILWDKYQFDDIKPTEEDYYLNLLHFGYATDENYINKLKQIQNENESH